MSEFGGLWQHQHTKHALYATKIISLMIVVAQRKREEEEGGRLSQQCRNTFTKRFSCNDVLRLLSGEVFPTMLAKFVKLLWGPFSIVIYSAQVVRGISARQNDV